MSRKRWKDQERRVADYFKTFRTPLSGSLSRHTGSDTLHPTLFIETKDRKNHHVWSLFEKVKEQAKAEGKIPVLCLTEPNRRGFLICLCSDDLTFDPLQMAQFQRGLVFEYKNPVRMAENADSGEETEARKSQVVGK